MYTSFNHLYGSFKYMPTYDKFIRMGFPSLVAPPPSTKPLAISSLIPPGEFVSEWGGEKKGGGGVRELTS